METVLSKIYELPKGIIIEVILQKFPMNLADEHRVIIQTNGMGGLNMIVSFGYDINKFISSHEQILAAAAKYYEDATREFCMAWYLEKLTDRLADLSALNNEIFKRVRYEG